MSHFLSRCDDVWASLNPRVRLILILSAFCFGGVLMSRHLASMARTIALERNSRLAEEALAEGNVQEARSRSLAAIQSDPSRIRVIRIVLRAMNTLNDPKRVEVARILMQHPEAHSSDRELGFRVLAHHGPMAWVGAAWAELSKWEKATPGMIDAFARRLIAEGKSGEAALILKDVDLSDPPDLISQLVIDLLQNQGSEEAWLESKSFLLKTTRAVFDAGEPIPDWCIDRWDRLPQEYLDPAILEAIPEEGPRRIQILRRRIEQGRRVLDMQDPVVAAWLQDCHPRDRLSLASMLAHCGLESLGLDLLEKAVGLTQEEYEWIRSTRVRAEAWRSWLNFLNSSAILGISKACVNADRAIAYRKLDRKTDSKHAWRGAMEAASIPNQSFRLIDLSNRVRPWMPTESEQALLAAVTSPDRALPLYNDLQWVIRSLQNARNDKALLDFCRFYLQIEPANPILVTRYAYLALLAGELSPAAALRMVTPVWERHPNSAHPRIIGVISSILLEDYPEALRWAAPDRVSWKDTPSFYQWLIARAVDPSTSSPPPDEATLLPSEYSLVQKLR